MPRMMIVDRLNVVKEELKKMNENHYSLMVKMQLTQKKVEQVKGESRRKSILIENSRKAAETRKRGGGEQGRGAQEVTKHRRNEISVQECFYGFEKIV